MVISSIPIDQTHQQNNACFKEMVKPLASLKNPNALWCWMVSGPEVAGAIEEFQEFLRS